MSENQNRPRGRKRNVTGQAKEIRKNESDLGTGPVGNAGQYQGRPMQQRPFGQQSGQSTNSRQESKPGNAFGQQRAQRPVTQQNVQRPPLENQGAQRPAGQSASQRRTNQQSAARSPVIHHSTGSSNRQSTVTGSKAGGSRSGCMPLIILLAVVLLGGGAGLSGLFGGGSDNSSTGSSNTSGYSQNVGSLLGDLLGENETGNGSGSGSSGSLSTSSGTQGSGSASSSLTGGSSTGSVIQSLMGSGSWYSMFSGADSNSAITASRTDSTALNTKIASGSREKFTVLKGNGKDKVTVLVYMCGADLESRSGMATKDLQEMLSASFGSKVNLIVFTGGSTQWRNSSVSSRVNQIWQVKNKKFVCLEENMGTDAMTNPQTLLSFLRYAEKNFKADRYQLILWDHGCGSVTGYGYDEKNQRAGSMSLAGIDSALKSSGMKFDFIGYDACLMATVENALMLSNYADYLIASEETEPGIGWFYTNWLTELGENTSVSTLELGKIICDDFTAACKKSCPGQTTTLSLVDLAELAHTVPDKLSAFSRSVTGLIEDKEYRTVSNARNGCREFASSSRTDMVDLTDLATKLSNQEGTALAKVLKSAVKYNRSTVADAYGLSIFFPYKKISSVDKAISTYEAIGLDDSYSEAIRAFASVESSGQAVSSQNSYQIPSILTSGGSSSALSGGAYGSDDMISSLLSSFLGGSDLGFLSGRQIDTEVLTEYISSNMFDPSGLVFHEGILRLPAEQWALVHSVDQNIFYDDGNGYIDLGLDQVFEWNEEGDLVADTSGAWLALNGQITPFYSTGTVDDGKTWYMNGYIPVLINGWRAELLITFDDSGDGGKVTGARWIYPDGETEASAKAVTELQPEDEIQLICDYYDYEGNYQSSHTLGKPFTVGSGLRLTDLVLPDTSKAVITYRLTDIYNQAYWTAPL